MPIEAFDQRHPTDSSPVPQDSIQSIHVLDPVARFQNPSNDPFSSSNMTDLPIDIFEADITAFLQGEVPVDVWNGWEWH